MATQSAVDRKIALLRSLRAEAGRMGELLAQEAYEELIRCLDIRGGYMERIDALDIEIAKGESPDASTRAEMAALIAEIQALDAKTAEDVGAVLKESRSGIRESNVNRNLAETYLKQMPGSRFINHKG